MKKNLIGPVLTWLFFFALLFFNGPITSVIFSFSVAVYATYVNFTPSKYKRTEKLQKKNVRIFNKIFGRFTWFAMYGCLIPLICSAILTSYDENLVPVRLRLILVGLFLIWGIFLCILLEVHKNDPDVNE